MCAEDITFFNDFALVAHQGQAIPAQNTWSFFLLFWLLAFVISHIHTQFHSLVLPFSKPSQRRVTNLQVVPGDLHELQKITENSFPGENEVHPLPTPNPSLAPLQKSPEISQTRAGNPSSNSAKFVSYTKATFLLSKSLYSSSLQQISKIKYVIQNI